MASWNISVGDGDLKADGTVPMSADWTFGDQDLVDVKQLAIGHSTPEAALDVRDAGAAIDPAAVIAGTVGMFVAGGTDAADCRVVLVGGGGAGSVCAIDFGDPADQDIGSIIYDHNANVMTIAVNAAVRITIGSDGNVLMGTTGTAEAPLDVRGTGTALNPAAVITETVAMFVGAGTDAADCRIALIGGGGAGSVCAIDFGDPADQNVGGILYDHNTNIMTFFTDAGVALTLHPTGRVLIGSNGASNSPLHVVGAVGGAIQVLTIEQFDIDDSLIGFKGTSAADSTRSLSSSTDEAAAKVGAVLCEINGAPFWIRGYASAV